MRSKNSSWPSTGISVAEVGPSIVFCAGVRGADRGARVIAAFDFPVIVSEYTPVRPIGLTVVDGTDRSSIMTSGATSSGDWGPAGSLRVTSMWNDAASARWTAICLSVLTRGIPRSEAWARRSHRCGEAKLSSRIVAAELA